MDLNRLRVCQEADLRLRFLKARTGLTPNLLCRLGFCLSLNDPTPPDPAQYPQDGPREINRYTPDWSLGQPVRGLAQGTLSPGWIWGGGFRRPIPSAHQPGCADAVQAGV